MGLLYLIGTVHWDLKGPERLRKFLGFVRPGYICLEASNQTIERVLSDRELIKTEMEKSKQFDKMMERVYARTGKQERKKSNGDFTLKFLSTLGYETWASYEHRASENPGAIIIPMHNHETLINGQAV